MAESIRAHDYEALGSDDGSYGFQTPLVNNHAYLGWAGRISSL